MSPRYRSLNSFLKERFGERVYRVSVDAGFTCPNRDGSKGTGGCAYCNESGSRAAYVEPEFTVAEQLRRGKEIVSRIYGAGKFITYFQPYSNTYAPVEQLERLYREALAVPDIAGIAIGTRPDTLNAETAELLAGLAKESLVILELGAQSMKDGVLRGIGRGHSADDTLRAFELVRGRGIHLAAHLIFGLPGENSDETIDGVTALSHAGADGFKFHHLYIERGTRMEAAYRAGGISLLTLDEYIGLLGRALDILPPDAVILRLFGQSSAEMLVAPEWTLDKPRNMRALEEYLDTHGITQGRNYQK